MRSLKWGLIGCGDIAERRVAPALQVLESCDLVGINRARFELAQPFADHFGARKVFRHWQDLIADDEIEAVYIATPVYLHAEQAITAAHAGKHVLCEKPMAMSVEECARMIEACKARRVHLGLAYYRHYYPAVHRIKQIVNSGELGRIVLIQISVLGYFDRQPGAPRHWLLVREQSGGGPMMDVGCHRIEVMLNIMGAVRRITGRSANIRFQREVEDTSHAHFEFENGAHGLLTVTHASYESTDTLDIFGTKGSIHVPVLNDGDMRIITAEGERIEKHPQLPNVHLPLIEDFTRSVLHDSPVTVDGSIGREVNRIIAKIYNN